MKEKRSNDTSSKDSFWNCCISTLFALIVLRALLINLLPGTSSIILESQKKIQSYFYETGNRFLTFSKANSSDSRTHLSFITRKIQSANPRVNAHQLAKTIIKQSRLMNVDPLVTAALIRSESTFKTDAVSPRGARGLMQLMPSTAVYIAKRHGLEPTSSQYLFHPAYNIKLGLLYLKYLENKFHGDRYLALAAYNWGPGNLIKAQKRKTSIINPVKHYAQTVLQTSEVWDNEFDNRNLLYH